MGDTQGTAGHLEIVYPHGVFVDSCENGHAKVIFIVTAYEPVGARHIGGTCPACAVIEVIDECLPLAWLGEGSL